jgi:hypothetical protein
MNQAAEEISQQLKEIELRRTLAEKQTNPDTYDIHNLPATWESKDKYGKNFITEDCRGIRFG